MDALEALAVLRREIDRDTVDAVPDGYKTVAQWAQAWGLQRSYSSVLLNEGVTAGCTLTAEFRVRTRSGFRRTAHYKICKEQI